MNWLPLKNTDKGKPPIEPHCIRSEDGVFYIARVYQAGMPYFELWRNGRKAGEVFEYADQDIEAVKRYAEQHPHPYEHENGG